MLTSRLFSDFPKLAFIAAVALVFLTVPVDAIEVRVSTSDGNSFQGSFVSVDDKLLVVDIDGATKELAVEALGTLQNIDGKKKTGPPTTVSLLGGSKIYVDSVTSIGDSASLEIRRQGTLRLPVKQISAVRFRKASSVTDPAWLGIVDSGSRDDRIVIRRPGDRLDPTGGIVDSIAENQVNFIMDGDTIPAPIDRLEGVVFGSASDADESPDVVITDLYGSRWSAKRIASASFPDMFEVQLTDDIVHEMPVDQVMSIRWTGGTEFLASAEPAETTVQPNVRTVNTPELFSKLFAPQPVVSDSSDMQSGDDSKMDLVLYGGTSVQYRVNPGYRRLVGSVSRLKSVASISETVVSIAVDDETIWSNALVGWAPLGFDLPIEDSRRVSVQVSSGQDGDRGSVVRLRRPRLVK